MVFTTDYGMSSLISWIKMSINIIEVITYEKISIRVLDEHEVKEMIGGIDRLHYEGENPLMKDMVGLCND